MPIRSTAARLAVLGVNRTSRAIGRGQGTVIGGRVGLAIDPDLLSALAKGKTFILVSGTNGKTTTTALVAAALGTQGPVASNTTGSNMPAGHVAALCGNPKATTAVLEVDESYLDAVLRQTSASVVTLLNLSRDQLDRTNEVRMIAERWRNAFKQHSGVTVVANADDPLVVYSATPAAQVVWVSAGLVWNEDATACPVCTGQIVFGKEQAWACSACDFSRPDVSWFQNEQQAVGPNERIDLTVNLPGQFNRANGLIALGSAIAAGVPGNDAARGIATVTGVAGRFVTLERNGESTRVMLAKNPAGWAALLGLVAESPAPIVIGINARTADGLDPSWLFDVPFERLAGRFVIATGDRWRDLSVRLHYADVVHEVAGNSETAVALAHRDGAQRVDFIGNYTAFQDILRGAQ